MGQLEFYSQTEQEQEQLTLLCLSLFPLNSTVAEDISFEMVHNFFGITYVCICNPFTRSQTILLTPGGLG